MRKILMLVLVVLLLSESAFAQNSTLRVQGSATQLVVDNKPYLVLGGELGNSSASCPQDIEANFEKLSRM